jgi:predicted nucleic acid-binding protein
MTVVSPMGDDLAQAPRVFYLDASALVKRYLAERGSAWVVSLCADENATAVAIANIGIIEVAAAFAAKRRGHFLSDPDYDAILSELLDNAQTRYWLVAISQIVMDHAIALTRRQKLRGYDAVHLACALALNKPLLDSGLPSLTFVAADDDLLAAAEAEGLPTENPNQYD